MTPTRSFTNTCLKTVATNRIMTGALALSPLETLLRMSPLAFLQAATSASGSHRGPCPAYEAIVSEQLDEGKEKRRNGHW